MIEGLNVDKVTASHQRLVLSPYWVVGGPNYTAMAATGCPAEDTCEYRYIFEHIYTYIYIYVTLALSLSLYIYIYIYIYVCMFPPLATWNRVADALITPIKARLRLY